VEAALGADRTASFFERTSGTLEYFDAQQEPDALQRLSAETGGRYYTLEDAAALPADIVYTQGGLQNGRCMSFGVFRWSFFYCWF